MIRVISVKAKWQDKHGSTLVTVKGFIRSLLRLDRHWNPLRASIQWVQRVILAGSDADQQLTSFQCPG
jgi:hypothetical protein